jgi:hypothetical protein
MDIIDISIKYQRFWFQQNKPLAGSPVESHLRWGCKATFNRAGKPENDHSGALNDDPCRRQTSHDAEGQFMTSGGQLMTGKDKCYRHKILGVRRRAKN